MAETTDSNTDSSRRAWAGRASTTGTSGLRYVTGSIYGGAAPTPTADGLGIMDGIQLDLGANGDGIDNQDVDRGRVSRCPNNDTFQATDTMTPLFDPIGDVEPAGSAISFSRGSEPSLEEERVMFRYRSISMGFGLEGRERRRPSNGTWPGGSLDWLLDEIDVDVAVAFVGQNRREATAHRDGDVQRRRRHRPVPVGLRRRLADRHQSGPSVTHRFHARHLYDVRVEVTRQPRPRDRRPRRGRPALVAVPRVAPGPGEGRARRSASSRWADRAAGQPPRRPTIRCRPLTVRVATRGVVDRRNDRCCSHHHTDRERSISGEGSRDRAGRRRVGVPNRPFHHCALPLWWLYQQAVL